MKKNVIAAFLAMSLALLTACSGQPSGDAIDTQASKPAASDAQTTEPVDTDSSSSETQASETADTTPSGTQTPESSAEDKVSVEALVGIYTESTYTYENEFIGIGCQLDQDWEVLDQAEIAELNGVQNDTITDDTIAEQMKNGRFMPFYAQKEGGLIGANIVVADLGASFGSVLTESAYVNLSISQLAPALEAGGISDVTTQAATVLFAGGQHAAVTASGNVDGLGFYETIVCVKVDQYMVVITASCVSVDVTDDILDMFYVLETEGGE